MDRCDLLAGYVFERYPNEDNREEIAGHS